MDEASLFPIRVDEKRECIVELMEGSPFVRDEAETNPEAPECERRLIDVEGDGREVERDGAGPPMLGMVVTSSTMARRPASARSVRRVSP